MYEHGQLVQRVPYLLQPGEGSAVRSEGHWVLRLDRRPAPDRWMRRRAAMTARGRLRPVASVSAAVAVLALTVVVQAAPSGAAPSGCRPLPNGNWECDNDSGGGTTPPPTDDDGNNNGGHGPGPAAGPAPGSCRWENFPDQELMKATYYPDAGPDDVVQYYVCNLGTAENPVWAEPGGNTTTRLAAPIQSIGPAPAPMPPAALADMFLISIRGELEVPRLITSPAAGMAAIVDQPTFVAVDNWQGDFARGPACHASGNLRLPAFRAPCSPTTPAYRVSIRSRVRAGDRSTSRAAPSQMSRRRAGARMRTQLGRVSRVVRTRTRAKATVRWTVSWTDETPGSSLTGTFPAFDIDSAVVDRPVDEVQGVVVDTVEGEG